VPVGTELTLHGRSADAEGLVAAVQVSTDGGHSWRDAAMLGTTWSFSLTPAAAGPQTVRVRAVDDSANAGAEATVTLDVTAPAR
jgi:hypothetical protein